MNLFELKSPLFKIGCTMDQVRKVGPRIVSSISHCSLCLCCSAQASVLFIIIAARVCNVILMYLYLKCMYRCIFDVYNVCSSKSIIYRYMVIVYYSCDRQIQNSDAAIITSLNFTEKYHIHRIPSTL